MKILIVGAGIAGLAAGWRFAQAGCSVEIVERGVAGRGATWASAGMLAPHAELGAEETALARFARAGRTAWPDFARDIEAESEQKIGFRENGSLLVAGNDIRAQTLEQRADGANAVWLTNSEARKREPLVSSDLRGALFVGGDAQVDNRALCPALAAALARRNAVLREHCEVRAVVSVNGRVLGVTTDRGAIESDIVILACGAWLNLIGGVEGDALPAIKPIKGQMLALETSAGTALPRTLIWDEDVYLVPRRDRLFVGATVEDSGFDTSITKKARDTLLAAATRIIPAASSWRVAEMWAGLRPRSADEAPVLGETAIKGLFVASGQFRNGILFAPAVAEAVARAVTGKPLGPDIAAFSPCRFAKD